MCMWQWVPGLPRDEYLGSILRRLVSMQINGRWAMSHHTVNKDSLYRLSFSDLSELSEGIGLSLFPNLLYGEHHFLKLNLRIARDTGREYLHDSFCVGLTDPQG